MEILDSTLREGEQTPGVSFSVYEKLEIARLLDELGIDIIEAGHPAVSGDIMTGLKKVASEGLDAAVLGHSRAIRDDIDLVLDCDAEWIGIFISVMDNRLKKDLGKDLETVRKMVISSVEYAKDHGLRVRYTPEDTIRSDIGSVISVSRAAVEAGADRISVADTVGASTPDKMRYTVSRVIEETGVDVNVHCHNDLGLALANSLAALDAGAVMADACVNGLGERAGITDLSTLMTALRVHHGAGRHWKLEMLPLLSDMVEERSGMKVSSNAPVVGSNAFSHNAGLHVSAAFVDPSFYEVVPAEALGRGRTFEMDKMTSRALVRNRLSSMGHVTDDDSVEKVYSAAKSLDKGRLTDAEISLLIGDSTTNNY